MEKTITKKAERNSSVEVLRILTMVSVLVGHSFGVGAKGEVPHYNLLLMFGMCINMFLLISGYYQIRFRVKSFLNLVGMVLFYSLISSVVAIFITGGVNLNYLVSAFLPISHNYFYWFISCYLVLMLLAPFINKGLEALPHKQLLFLTVVLAYINLVTGWLFKNGSNPNGFNVVQFIFIYVLGYGIRRYDIASRMKMGHGIAAYVVLSILISLMLDRLPSRWGGYNNPLVVLKSVIGFCIFLKIKFHSRVVNHIAACVFPCYLLQEGATGLLFYNTQYQVWQACQSPLYYLAFAIACAAGFFVLSLLMERVRKPIMGWVMDRLYGWLRLERIDEIVGESRVK